LTSNKNNSNQTQQPEQEINKFQHFIPGFAKRREIYNKAPPVRSGRQFPYIKEPLEYAYEKFISEVVNPSDSTYYPKTDENNRPIPIQKMNTAKEWYYELLDIDYQMALRN
jgi:hypothetical protein